MIDLGLVSTDELLIEVMKRFDSSIFAGHKNLADQGPMKTVRSRYRRWNGDRSVCSGLCFEVSLCCATDQLNGEAPGQDDLI